MFAACIQGRLDLAACEGRIKALARELEQGELTENEKFMLVWSECHSIYYKLEDYRQP